MSTTAQDEQAFATPVSFCRVGSTCFDVTSTANSGPGTLRQAILDANAASAALTKEIHFLLGSGGPHTIALTTQLPSITADSVQILGFTQTGAVRATDTTQAQLQVVLDGSALFGQSGLVLEGQDAKVEGLAIVNFDVDGIRATGDASLIKDNFIGVDVDGVTPAGNGRFGVMILNSDGSRVEGNLIGANVQGLYLSGLENLATNNIIGTDFSGTLDLGNVDHGIYVVNGPVQIGGKQLGEGNLIAFNGGDGISVWSGSGHGLYRNFIYENADLGIDLGNDGVTTNDGAPDADTGVNGLQNFPILESVSLDANSKATVTWKLRAKENVRYHVQFFYSEQCDPSGRGEGEVFVGARTIYTDGNGRVTNTWQLPGIVPSGSWLTALATEFMEGVAPPSSDEGSTSEFSRCLHVP